MKHRADIVERPVGGRPARAPGRHTQQVRTPAVGSPPGLVPATVTWTRRRRRRALVSATATVATVAVVPATAYFWQMRTESRMQVLVFVCLLAVGLRSVLTAHRPRRIVLKGSLLTVHGRRQVETFDLADALQTVELSGDPTRKGWTLALDRGDASRLVLTRRDVDAVTLDTVVQHYRDLAGRRAHQRWARLGL